MKKKIKYKVLVLAIFLFGFLLLYPLFPNQDNQIAFALLITVALLWMTEAVPLAMTALLIPVAAVVLQLLPTNEAFQEFAHPVIFLFMGGFVLAGALSKYGLDKLLGQKLLKLANGNFYKSSILLMLATALTACWVSNTSTVAMMLPLGLGILVLINKDTSSNESRFLMLGIAYSANSGGIITMVGSPPNAIGAAALDLSFLQWSSYAFPVFLLTFPVMVLLLTLYFKPDRSLTIGAMISPSKERKPNKALLGIFFLTVLLWMMDGVVSPLLHIQDNFNSLVALMAIFLLLVTKVLSWEEIQKSIRWEILLLFGGGLTLGKIIEHSGLAAILVGHVSSLITAIPILLFLWIIVLFTILLTEFMSNTASAALIVPLLYSLAIQLHINPIILVFPATIAASYGFMLPVGTPPNAMAISTGEVPQRDMMRIGLLLNLLFSIILTLYFYFVLY